MLQTEDLVCVLLILILIIILILILLILIIIATHTFVAFLIATPMPSETPKGCPNMDNKFVMQIKRLKDMRA